MLTLVSNVEVYCLITVLHKERERERERNILKSFTKNNYEYHISNPWYKLENQMEILQSSIRNKNITMTTDFPRKGNLFLFSRLNYVSVVNARERNMWEMVSQSLTLGVRKPNENRTSLSVGYLRGCFQLPVLLK